MSDDEYGGGALGDDYDYGGGPGYDNMLNSCSLHESHPSKRQLVLEKKHSFVPFLRIPCMPLAYGQ